MARVRVKLPNGTIGTIPEEMLEHASSMGIKLMHSPDEFSITDLFAMPEDKQREGVLQAANDDKLAYGSFPLWAMLPGSFLGPSKAPQMAFSASKRLQAAKAARMGNFGLGKTVRSAKQRMLEKVPSKKDFLEALKNAKNIGLGEM